MNILDHSRWASIYVVVVDGTWFNIHAVLFMEWMILLGGKKSAKYKMMMARGLILLRIKRCALRPLIYTISLSIVGSNPVCAVKK